MWVSCSARWLHEPSPPTRLIIFIVTDAEPSCPQTLHLFGEAGHAQTTDKLDLKQVANDFVSGDQHRCYLPQNGWVWLGGCGFGLTTLKELAPGLQGCVLYEFMTALPC